jgi:AraC-like DNA-binding protein
VSLLETAVGDADDVDDVLAQFQWAALENRLLELPAGARHPFAGPGVRFHFLARGAVRLVGAQLDVSLHAGDFLLLPRGGRHDVTAEDDAVLQTGALQLASRHAPELAERLPDQVLAKSLAQKEPFVATLLENMAAEWVAGRPGSASVASRLADVVATTAIRTWVESGCGRILSIALRNVEIANAVSAIHADPGRDWTVEALARLAHTSRSAFIEHFRETTGEPPARYVTRVRMDEAKRMLQHPRASISQVAATLGYGSDAAFSRAFRRVAGVAPTVWRRPPAAPADAADQRRRAKNSPTPPTAAAIPPTTSGAVTP